MLARNLAVAYNKLYRCLGLARACSRLSWIADPNLTPAHRREYKRLRRESMQDARYWRDEIRKNLEN
jgi:hypothetical protein